MRTAVLWIGLALALWITACAPAPLTLDVHPIEGGVEVVASAPVGQVELLDGSGAVVVRRVLPTPTEQVFLTAPLLPSSHYTVRADSRGRGAVAAMQTPARTALQVEVEAPLGQGRRAVRDGEIVVLTVVRGATIEAGLVLTAREPVAARVSWAGVDEPVTLGVRGERAISRRILDGSSDIPVAVEMGSEVVRFTLSPRLVDAQAAREAVVITGTTLPARYDGTPDRARPSDRIPLPAAWWTTALRATGLGFRPRDDQAPWAWQAIQLENRGDTALDVVVTSAIVGADGQPAPAFRSRVREADAPGGAVSVLLTVPAAGGSTAVLPVYVDARAVRTGVYQRVLEVTPLGASKPLHRTLLPLYVTRGSSWASGGFVLALLASFLGLVVLVRRAPSWLREADTSELMTIALFGSLTFVVAAAARLLGYGVASVLGPFAPLLTGLVDDAFRTCLLAALVVLLPRPGVVTLASLVGYLMRGLALGSFHPVDLLYLGSVVTFLEGGLWLAGLTRDPTWRDGSWWARFLRLSAGFALANTLAVASGLVVTVVLYRLFLADWYVAMMLLGPGFFYVIVGCWLAVDFAASLRRVEA